MKYSFDAHPKIRWLAWKRDSHVVDDVQLGLGIALLVTLRVVVVVPVSVMVTRSVTELVWVSVMTLVTVMDDVGVKVVGLVAVTLQKIAPVSRHFSR